MLVITVRTALMWLLISLFMWVQNFYFNCILYIRAILILCPSKGIISWDIIVIFPVIDEIGQVKNWFDVLWYRMIPYALLHVEMGGRWWLAYGLIIVLMWECLLIPPPWVSLCTHLFILDVVVSLQSISLSLLKHKDALLSTRRAWISIFFCSINFFHMNCFCFFVW